MFERMATKTNPLDRTTEAGAPPDKEPAKQPPLPVPPYKPYAEEFSLPKPPYKPYS